MQDSELKSLIDKLIPPSDYQHRNGFSNEALLNSLTKVIVEDVLIDRLIQDKGLDDLIIESLAILKSQKAVPVLRERIMNASDEFKIIISTAIFEITKEKDVYEIAKEAFKRIDANKDAYHKFRIVSMFYYLGRLMSPEINKVVLGFTNHPDSMVSYNAKRFSYDPSKKP
jgi:hypothetical protein